MLGSNKSPGNNRGKNTVEGALYGLSTVLALIATLLVTPQLFSWSDDFIYRYLLSSYGDTSFAAIGTYIWGALIGGGIFFLSRALIVLALILIAQRLLFWAF